MSGGWRNKGFSHRSAWNKYKVSLSFLTPLGKSLFTLTPFKAVWVFLLFILFSCRTTYITCPLDHEESLGIGLPVLNLLVKKSGEKWGFEITVSTRAIQTFRLSEESKFTHHRYKYRGTLSKPAQNPREIHFCPNSCRVVKPVSYPLVGGIVSLLMGFFWFIDWKVFKYFRPSMCHQQPEHLYVFTFSNFQIYRLWMTKRFSGKSVWAPGKQQKTKNICVLSN